MRYVQHAEKMIYSRFRGTLRNLAAEEKTHAKLIAAKIKKLGGKLPEVIPIHVAHEPNSWYYLRTDLEEEQRCAGELEANLPTLRTDYPDVAELLDRIEREGKCHRAKIRDMLARSDPQAVERA
jgi:rubrerythrin